MRRSMHNVSRYAVAATWCAGMGLLAWFLAQTTFFLSVPTEPRVSKPLRVVSATTVTAEQGTASTVQMLTSRNVMRILPLPAAGKRADTAPLTETSLPPSLDVNRLPVSQRGWTLLGTVVQSSRASTLHAPEPRAPDAEGRAQQPVGAFDAVSRAIILHDGTQRVYRQGDQIQGWELSLVQRRMVVLSKGGVRERLIINETALQTAASPRSVQQHIVTQQQLRGLIQDIPSLLRTVTVEPQRVGAYQGLRVTSLAAGSVLQTLGVQEQDLILSINNTALTSMGALAGLMGMLDVPKLELEVLRQGTKTRLAYVVQR